MQSAKSNLLNAEIDTQLAWGHSKCFHFACTAAMR
jgi:hypothetical protein